MDASAADPASRLPASTIPLGTFAHLNFSA